MAAGGAADGAVELGGLHDVVGADRLGERHLMRVPGTDDDVGVGHVPAEPGDGGEAHRAGAEHRDDRVRDLGDRGPGQQGGVDAARERLDEHRPFVGHGVGDPVELELRGYRVCVRAADLIDLSVRPLAAGEGA